MRTLPSAAALGATILLIGCTTKPEVVFTTPALRSSASSVAVSAAHENASSVSVQAVSSAPSPLPRSVSIDVPFAVQAPFADWGDPYQEACEEAALILVHHYLTGEPMSPTVMDKAILDLVAWETDHGYGEDVTMEQLAAIAREYYGHEAIVSTDVSVFSVQDKLRQGNPIILPLAGRDLGNPYFSGEGPWYHTVVVSGYDGSHFITQEIGTKRGEDYAYAYDVLLDAVHDWTGVKEEINQGKRAMLIVR